MKKGIKVALISVAGLLVSCLFILGVGISYLRSDAGSQWILNYLKQYLAKNEKMSLDYKEGSFDPFSGFRFKDLIIKQDLPSQRLEVKAEKLAFHYRFSIFSRTLEIDLFQFKSPSILFHQIQSKPAAATVSSTTTKPSSSAALATWFRVRIPQVEISNLNLDLDLKSSEKNLHTQVKNAEFYSSASWSGDVFQSSGHLNFGKIEPIYWAQESGGQKDEASFIPFGEFHWDFQVKKKDTYWFYPVQPSKLSFGLKELNYAKKSSKKPYSTSLKNLEIRADLNFSGEGSLSKEKVSEFPIHGQLKFLVLQNAKQGPLVDYGPIVFDSKFAMHYPKASWDGVLHLKDETPLRVQSYLEVKKEALDLSSTWILKTGRYLEKFLSQRQMKEVGQWELKTQLDLKAQKPKSEADPILDKGVIQASVISQLTQTKLRSDFNKKSQFFPFLFSQPISLEQKLEIHEGKTEFGFQASVPSVQIDQIGEVLDTQLLLAGKAPSYQFNKNVEISLHLDQGRIHLAKEWSTSLGSKPVPLYGLQVALNAAIPSENRVVLKKLTADLNHSMVKLDAEATGNSKTGNFQSKGALSLHIPSHFPELRGQYLSGEAELPWVMSISKGRHLHFEGDMNLTDLKWIKGPYRVEGVTGKIPVTEDLILDEGQIKFAYLMVQNPFERVDYERLQPMIHDTEQFHIQKISFEEKNYGPFQGFFSFRQNQVAVHKFDFNLGSGRSNGELYFDVQPLNWQVGIHSRLTGLQLEEILPKSLLKEATHGNEKLSGRMGLVLNLNRGAMDGRVDLTEIGQKQLLSLIQVLDPKNVNEQMNRARYALGIAYPRRVEMAFQKGYLDMGVTLGGVISNSLTIQGIPMTAWVSHATSELTKKSKEVPIQ